MNSLVMFFSFIATLSISTFVHANIAPGPVANSECNVQVDNISRLIKTDFGHAQLSFYRVRIGNLGKIAINRTFDVISEGASLDGTILERIRVDFDKISLDVHVTAGEGKNPNVVTFGLSGQRAEGICK